MSDAIEAERGLPTELRCRLCPRPAMFDVDGKSQACDVCVADAIRLVIAASDGFCPVVATPLPDDEIWLSIPSAPDREASNHGRVRSVPHVVIRSNGKSCRVQGRLLRPYAMRSGHVQVTVAGQKKRLVHHLVLEAFIGPRPDGLECCHNDGNPVNNNINNLRWDTTSSNVLDRVRHGTHHLARRTACPRGHALIEPNLVTSVLKRGRRQCRACHRATARLALLRNRGGEGDLQTLGDIAYRELMGPHGFVLRAAYQEFDGFAPPVPSPVRLGGAR